MNTSRSLHTFAVIVAISTFILIFAGGLVTSTGSGLSVPDWPLSFGKLFPEMKGGVAYEHGHRMVAAIVGFLTVVLAAWILKAESRKSVRIMAILAVIAVIAQGVLGGATVLFGLPAVLSVGHAAVAEIFLCLTVAIALLTSKRWKDEPPQIADSGNPPLRNLALMTTCVVYAQILLGALMRHTGGGLSIPDFPLSYGRLVPPFFTAPIFFNYAHRIVGIAVIVFVVWFSVRVLRLSERGLRIHAVILLGSLLLQVVLGAVAIWSRKAPVPTTFHVVCGAFTLAVCFWLMFYVFRILAPSPRQRRVQVAAA